MKYEYLWVCEILRVCERVNADDKCLYIWMWCWTTWIAIFIGSYIGDIIWFSILCKYVRLCVYLWIYEWIVCEQTKVHICEWMFMFNEMCFLCVNELCVQSNLCIFGRAYVNVNVCEQACECVWKKRWWVWIWPCIWVQVCVCVCVCVWRERDRDRDRETQRESEKHRENIPSLWTLPVNICSLVNS